VSTAPASDEQTNCVSTGVEQGVELIDLAKRHQRADLVLQGDT
jgi:hypothetical protein